MRALTSLLAVLLAAGCQLLAPFSSTSSGADGPDSAGPDATVDAPSEARLDAGADAPPPPAHLWSHRLGHAGVVELTAVATDVDGNIYGAGSLRGAVDVGGGALTSAGGRDVLVASFDADGDHRWSRRFGGAGGDACDAIAVDASGNVFVVGRFSEAIDFGGGLHASTGAADAFIASFDKSGAHRWSRRASGDDDDDRISGVVVTSHRIAVTGTFSGTVDLGGGELTAAGVSDIFLAAFTADSGVHGWSERYGTASQEQAAGIAADASGNIAITGVFSGTTDFGQGPIVSAGERDILLASFQSDGTPRWAQGHGGTEDDAGQDVAVDEAGNVAIAGGFRDAADFNGDKTPDVTSNGGSDAFVASYDSGGGLRWLFAIGGVGDDAGHRIAVDPTAGSVLATGTLAGEQSDVFVASFDGSGFLQGTQTLSSREKDHPNSIALDAPRQRVILAGRVAGRATFNGVAYPGGDDTFLASLASTQLGTMPWINRFPAGAGDVGRGVAIDPLGDVYVGGSFAGSGTFATRELTSAGGADAFVAGFGAQGKPRWAERFGAAGNDHVRGVAADASGVVVTGAFAEEVELGGVKLLNAGGDDIFLARFGSGGALGWALAFGSDADDHGHAAAIGPSGELHVAGVVSGPIGFGGSEHDVVGQDPFTLTRESDGTHVASWVRGGDGDDAAWSIAADASGNTFVTGAFEGTADFGGGALTSAGGKDVFVVAFDAGGQHRWSRRFGGSGDDLGLGIAVDASGNLCVTGFFVGAVDFGDGALTSAGGKDTFVVVLDAEGKHSWSQGFGAELDDKGLGVAIGPAGEVLVTGSFHGAVDFGGGALSSEDAADVFLASFTSAGAHRWSQRFGGPGSDAGHAVAATAGAVVLAGRFAEAIDFGGGPIVGADAGFVAALAP